MNQVKGKTPIYLSVVIPCYNEEKRLRHGIAETKKYLQGQKYSWELVVVDDGSIDHTFAQAEELLRDTPHQLYKHPQNQGKGAAIKTGVEKAGGKYILFYDIDLSTSLSEIPRFLEKLKLFDMVIGIRRHKEAKVLKHQTPVREFLGHIFTKLTNFLVTPDINDVTCGFKGFRKTAALKLFSRSRIKRWAFDAEILFLARKYHFSIIQVPVVWADNSATKVHVVADGVRAFFDLLKIRLFNFLGYYGD